MDSISALRTSWKVRFVALGIGILVAGAVFGIALGISDDLRLLYVSGALLFAVAAFFLSTKAQEDLITAVLLLLAATFLFAFFVLSQTPVLWPTALFWAVIAVWMLFRKRFTTIITVVGIIMLIAASVWYCASYIPVQMQRTLTHAGNGAAPTFTLEPVSQSTVPVRHARGKILVLDFFATWCAPCMAELQELERVRADLRDNNDIEFVLVGTNEGGDTPERVRAFAQRRRISLPVAFDPEQRTMRAFGLNGFPNLVVIDRTGRVRLIHTGYNSSETNFRRDLTQLLPNL